MSESETNVSVSNDKNYLERMEMEMTYAVEYFLAKSWETEVFKQLV